MRKLNGDVIKPEELKAIFPSSLIQQEFSMSRFIEMPSGIDRIELYAEMEDQYLY